MICHPSDTSSFFKVSLKSNNKALAKALAIQSEKTRQLIQEIVLLRKRVLALQFDLANQRHQKKELVRVGKRLECWSCTLSRWFKEKWT